MSTSTYIDPRVLRSLGSTQLRARGVVEGVIAGIHRNPHRGSSVEFAEYKEYAPGDDVRHIDWRAFARVDRYYVKQFEDETNLRAWLLLDSSGSMGFSWEDAPTKLLYASTLVASLAWLLLRQGDAPGLVTFREDAARWLPPSSRRDQLEDLCRLLDELQPEGGTAVERAMARLAERVHQRSLIVLVSDLLDGSDELLRTARVLRRRGLEVAVFHIMDRAEWTLPWEDMTLFEGMEGDGELLVEPDGIRAAYQRALREHLQRIEQTCRASDIEYARVLTDEPLEPVLISFVDGRRRGAGRRR